MDGRTQPDRQTGKKRRTQTGKQKYRQNEANKNQTSKIKINQKINHEKKKITRRTITQKKISHCGKKEKFLRKTSNKRRKLSFFFISISKQSFGRWIDLYKKQKQTTAYRTALVRHRTWDSTEPASQSATGNQCLQQGTAGRKSGTTLEILTTLNLS